MNVVWVPISRPGGYIWWKKPKSLILCGWSSDGIGKVIKVKLDCKGGSKDFRSLEKEWEKKKEAIIDWAVDFEKRVLDIAWGPSKKKIFILMEDGGIRYAEKRTRALGRCDFKSLSWEGGYPSKILGDPYGLKIEFGKWDGWPFGRKDRLLLREWTQSSGDMLVFPKKFFILRVGGGKVWVEGEWGNPAVESLGFLGLPLKAGTKFLCLSGVVGEPFEIFAAMENGKTLVGRGRIGEKGIARVEVPSGLRFGSPYWIVGPAYRVTGNLGTIAAPVLEKSAGFSAENVEVSEWYGPLPERVYVGSRAVSGEVCYTLIGKASKKDVGVFLLVSPQMAKESPPLFNLSKDKVLVDPRWIAEMGCSQVRDGALKGRVELPCVPSSCKGLVFWVQSVLVAEGGVVAGTKPRSYAVLGEVNVEKGESSVDKGLREVFLIGWRPPNPCVPRYSPKNEERLKDWLGKSKDFRHFDSLDAGFHWMTRGRRK